MRGDAERHQPEAPDEDHVEPGLGILREERHAGIAERKQPRRRPDEAPVQPGQRGPPPDLRRREQHTEHGGGAKREPEAHREQRLDEEGGDERQPGRKVPQLRAAGRGRSKRRHATRVITGRSMPPTPSTKPVNMPCKMMARPASWSQNISSPIEAPTPASTEPPTPMSSASTTQTKLSGTRRPAPGARKRLTANWMSHRHQHEPGDLRERPLLVPGADDDQDRATAGPRTICQAARQAPSPCGVGSG